MYRAFTRVLKFYYNHGWCVRNCNGDPEFGALQQKLHEIKGGPKCILAAKGEHLGPIEQQIQVVKERFRGWQNTVPYDRIPQLLMVHALINIARMLNHFPRKGGITADFSPRALVVGEQLDVKKELLCPVGAYCQVHEHEEPRNSPKARTQGAISLGPMGNDKGGYYFMSLRTGKKLKRYSWDELPMPKSVIKRVEKLAAGQPTTTTFTNRKDRPFADSEPTGVYVEEEGLDPLLNSDDDDLTIPKQPPLEFDEDDSVANEIAQDDNEGPEVGRPPEANEPQVETVEEDKEDDAQSTGVRFEEVPEAIPNIAEPGEPDLVDVRETRANAVPKVVGSRRVTAGLRWSTRNRTQAKQSYIPSFTSEQKYETTLAQCAEVWEKDNILHPDAHLVINHVAKEQPNLVKAILMQLSMKAGIKKWGDKAKDAIKKEMAQLHHRDTFKPLHKGKLTEEQRKRILRSHLFLKLKQDGTLMCRTVAGGNKQRDFISK